MRHFIRSICLLGILTAASPAAAELVVVHAAADPAFQDLDLKVYNSGGTAVDSLKGFDYREAASLKAPSGGVYSVEFQGAGFKVTRNVPVSSTIMGVMVVFDSGEATPVIGTETSFLPGSSTIVNLQVWHGSADLPALNIIFEGTAPALLTLDYTELEKVDTPAEVQTVILRQAEAGPVVGTFNLDTSSLGGEYAVLVVVGAPDGPEPLGLLLVTPDGQVKDVPVPVRTSSWGRIKATYR